MTGTGGRGVGSIRLVRTTIELAVLGIGWVLGRRGRGRHRVFALSIGPLLHLLLPRLQVSAKPTEGDGDALEPSGAPFAEPEGR